MRLILTPNSPYARVVRLIAFDAGVALTLNYLPTRDAADEILRYTPTGKVPTLVLDDGTTLSDTRVICEHIQVGCKKMYVSPVSDTSSRHWEGLVAGFLDGIAVFDREVRREVEDQSPSILALEKRRALRCLDHFEQHWEHDRRELNFASATLFAALDIADRRCPLDWRLGCPKMAQWLEDFRGRPEAIDTAPLPPDHP